MRGLRTACGTGALAVALALCGGGVRHAAAEAPSATAWWSATGTPGGQVPAPPDVASGDLLVEGAGGPVPPAPQPPAPPVQPPAPLPAPPGAPPGALAVAALSFPVATGATVGTLTLVIAGVKPLAVGIIACPITGGFRPVENGPLSDVPAFDCSTHDTATLAPDGASLSFAHLGSMVRGGGLSIVLLPGAADRVVLSRPGPAVLAVIPAPPPAPDDLAPVPPPPPAPAPAPEPVTAPVLTPPTATPPAAPRRHHRALPRATATPAPPGPLHTAPRVILVATLAAIAAAALVLRRPATAAGTRGFHRFARERTGPAPRV